MHCREPLIYISCWLFPLLPHSYVSGKQLANATVICRKTFFGNSWYKAHPVDQAPEKTCHSISSWLFFCYGMRLTMLIISDKERYSISHKSEMSGTYLAALYSQAWNISLSKHKEWHFEARYIICTEYMYLMGIKFGGHGYHHVKNVEISDAASLLLDPRTTTPMPP